jgi:redox-sensing transcriptional repressor
MAEVRLPLGVAARLSRYLQILTQAKKTGKNFISSKILSEYANVNPTQIRRDLSSFGKFGKRGVGYNVSYLIEQIREILHTSGQHNIALMGSGNLGTAIAGSKIFADHGFNVVALFDVDPAKIGKQVGNLVVQPVSEVVETVRERHIVVGVLAVPPSSAQAAANALIDAGVKIIFNYIEALVDAPPGVAVHSMSPAGELLYALYFYLA